MSKQKKPIGFWQNISNEQLITYMQENHMGLTLGQVNERDSKACLTARQRGLLDLLVEKGILVRMQRKKGHSEKMSNEELLEYIKENYEGKTIGEFEHSDGLLCQKTRDRGLMEKLVQENILVRKRQNNLFYKDMADQEIINFVEKHHKGKRIGEAEGGKNGYAITIARERGLLDQLVEDGILVRARVGASFSKMSNEELLKYIEENHKGKTVGELHDADHSFDLAYERGLLDQLVEKGIIVRRKKRQGFYSKMSDDDLLNYISENHKGKTIGELNDNDRTACKIATQRGLIDLLVEKGILVRRHTSGIYSKMSNEELIAFITENYKGKTLAEAQKGRGKQTYIIARTRGLIETLVGRGILVRESRYGFFKKMSDKQLIDHITENYKGKSSKELSDCDGGVYNQAIKRGLIAELVKQGVLIQKHKESKYRAMNDNEVLLYTERNYNGYSLKKLRETDSQLAGTLYRRQLLDGLVQQRIIVIGRKRKGNPMMLLENILEGGNENAT